MPHSHLVVRHLLKQLESHVPASQRERRPEWMRELIVAACESLSPLQDLGRVGAECEAVDQQWELRLYFGARELVGGPFDGATQLANFEVDLKRLLALFETVTTCQWLAFPALDGARSFISIAGTYAGQAVSVKIYSHPPRHSAPGLRQRADGSLETC